MLYPIGLHCISKTACIYQPDRSPIQLGHKHDLLGCVSLVFHLYKWLHQDSHQILCVPRKMKHICEKYILKAYAIVKYKESYLIIVLMHHPKRCVERVYQSKLVLSFM